VLKKLLYPEHLLVLALGVGSGSFLFGTLFHVRWLVTLGNLLIGAYLGLITVAIALIITVQILTRGRRRQRRPRD
jgi:hypothetical protein